MSLLCVLASLTGASRREPGPQKGPDHGFFPREAIDVLIITITAMILATVPLLFGQVDLDRPSRAWSELSRVAVSWPTPRLVPETKARTGRRRGATYNRRRRPII